MAWDSVPWFVGGGAQHSPEVARTLAYAAFNGNEGIMGADDLAVKALTVPGSSVTIDPGVVTILNRATGGTYQSYGGRLATQDTLAIPATSGTARSDLIIARVEDPFMAGEPWADPTDATVGPYIFTRRIAGVPNTTKTVASLNLGYSAVEVARIDIPASTGTITQAMITDLRKIANPRSTRSLQTANITATHALTSATAVAFPPEATWSVNVPPWARHITVRVDLTSVLLQTASNDGFLFVSIGSTLVATARYDEVWGGATTRNGYIIADSVPLPSAMAGTVQTIAVTGRRNAGSGTITVDASSGALLDVDFTETT